MRFFRFILEIFKKFPLLLIANIGLSVVVSLFGACSLFTISPIVDFFLHPDLSQVSPLTLKVINVFKLFWVKPTLGNLLTVFIIFIILSSAFHIFARHSILKTKYAVIRELMLGSFEDFFNARWYFFSSGRQGMLLNTFTRELNIVGDAFGIVALFFASILQILIFLILPFYLSWQVTLISLGCAFLFTLPFILLGKFSYKLGLLNSKTANQMISVIHENLSLAKVVLGFGNQEKSVDNLSMAFQDHRKATLKSQVLNIAIPTLYRPFGLIMVVIALFAARRFGVPFSEITVLLLALFQIALDIGHLTMHRTSVENFFPSYEQIKTLRQKAKQLAHESGQKQFTGFKRELLISELTFAYPDQEAVLMDINMRIPKGNMVALVGESGAGKSTFIDMVMGFHKPLKGCIIFDDVGLEDFDIRSYRRKIGYVPQDSVLFNMSIRDNLLWSYESASDEEIAYACRQANAEDFIRQLPEGYHTIVGDRGVRLSGGQVQRIALARAILRKPELLILDEATSSLDTYSERLIQQAIDNIAKETTIIVIAHRLSTIVNADYIYVLINGRIAEEGKYSELIQKDSHFSRMVKLQVLQAVK